MHGNIDEHVPLIQVFQHVLDLCKLLRHHIGIRAEELAMGKLEIRLPRADISGDEVTEGQQFH